MIIYFILDIFISLTRYIIHNRYKCVFINKWFRRKILNLEFPERPSWLSYSHYAIKGGIFIFVWLPLIPAGAVAAAVAGVLLNLTYCSSRIWAWHCTINLEIKYASPNSSFSFHKIYRFMWKSGRAPSWEQFPEISTSNWSNYFSVWEGETLITNHKTQYWEIKLEEGVIQILIIAWETVMLVLLGRIYIYPL